MSANATVVDSDGKYGAALYESSRRRSPYDHDGDGFSEIGKLKSNTLGINAFYRIDDETRLTVEYHNTYEFRRGGNKFELEPHQADITEQTIHYINSGGIAFTRHWHDFSRRINVYASGQQIDRNSYYGARQNPDAYGKTDDMTVMGGAVFSGDFNRLLWSPAAFTAGVEYQHNMLHDVMTGYGRDMRQRVGILGMFAQNEWKMRRFTLLAGVRMDIHNLIENPIISPRLNLLYRPMPAWQLRATWSTGFRAPQAYDEDLHVTAVGGEGVVIQLADGLKPERSNSFSISVDRDMMLGGFNADVILDAFYTDLHDVFVLEKMGKDADGITVQERRNGNGAKVYGCNLEFKAAMNPYSLQLGFTAQKSRYVSMEKWSEDPTVAATRTMLRAPGLYGYFILGAKPLRHLDCSVSGVYTGRMYVPHYAPSPDDLPDGYQYVYICRDELLHSPSFFELGLKVAYDIQLGGKLTMQLNAGAKNLLNSFQRDLDKGTFRDSGYFYGPTSPRTYFCGIKFIVD